MNKETIKALAEYFTGEDVGFHSIALSIPHGLMRLNERAKRFFEIREKLGIKGYDDSDDAEKAITKKLNGIK